MKAVHVNPDILAILAPLLLLLWQPLTPRSVNVERALDLANLTRNEIVIADQLEIAAANQPWRVDFWEKAGQAAFAGGEYSQAVQDFKWALASGTITAENRLAIGDSYRFLGDSAKAVAIYNGLLETRESAEIYQRIVDVELAGEDYTAAVETYDRWLRFQPDQAENLFRAGLINGLVNPDKGLPLLIKAEKLDTAYAEKVIVLQTAINTADLSEDPAYQKLVLGRGYAAIEEWTYARYLFQQAVESNPGYAEAWAFLGEAREKLGSSGITEFKKAYQLSPDSTLVQVLYALYWEQKDQPGKAVQLLEKTVKLEPENVTWQIELAQAYALMGKVNEASQWYQNATFLQPENSFTWQSLANFSLLYNQDVSGLGIAAARKAVALDADDPVSLDIMAQALIETGDSSTAERFLQRTLELDPGYALAMVHYAILYLQAGDVQSARPYLLQAVDLDPDGPVGSQAKRLLVSYGGGVQ